VGVNEVGAFVPTTNIWDVTEIYSTDVTSPEFKELLVRLYQNLNLMSLQLNIKDSAYYNTQEFVNGQVWFSDPAYNSTSQVTATGRQVYRKVINFGTLPNAGTTNVAHGITCDANTTFTRIYGCATDPAAQSYLPLPYASTTLVNSIELSVGNTNVSITTGIDRTAYTVTYVVLEYLKL